jgi:selenocysteine lyase/cysteine desulfurase
VITHLINHTGHVLPVHKLCALGRERNLQIFVDAAHSFAHLAFKVAEIDCDYLCSSLHKWLGGPLGTGMLYVRQNRIVGLTPLFADTEVAANDIRKLAHFGDSPDQMHFGLREAIRWHNQLGSLVKEARLRFLQRRWTEVARTLPGVRLLTPRDSARHGAIGVFAVDGMTPEIIVHRLMAEHRIFVNAVVHPVVKGVRVTPGICSSTEDIDCLIAALRVIATSR